MKTPTPRTDAEEKYFNSNKLRRSTELQSIYNFARQLEQELNEAKAELENTKGTEAIWNAVQELSPWVESNDMEWSDEILCGLAGAKTELATLKRERDEARKQLHFPSHRLYIRVLKENNQLRNVADELANVVSSYDDTFKWRSSILEIYSQLPHVLERKTK